MDNHLTDPTKQQFFCDTAQPVQSCCWELLSSSFRDGSHVSCHMDPHRWLNYTIPSQAKLGNRRLVRSHSKWGVTFFSCLPVFSFQHPLSFLTKHFVFSFSLFSFLCKLHQLIAFAEHSHDSNSLSNLRTREKYPPFPSSPAFLPHSQLCWPK